MLQSRHPFPRLGKGGEIGLNFNEVLLMNLTNSPYERITKEAPRYEKLTPQKSPGRGLIGGGLPVFSAGKLKKSQRQ